MATLQAPPEYWELAPDQKQAICNGCGPGNWKIDLIPDSLCGVDISEACNIHDFEYWQGLDFEGANRRLVHNAVECCLDGSPLLLPVRMAEVGLFHVAVTRHGRKHFGGGRS